MEITIGGGDDEPEVTEYEHIYEVGGEGGPTHRLITSDQDPPEISEAAELFEVAVSDLSWIMSRAHESEEVESASVPCNECGEPVWTSKQRAEQLRQTGSTTTCGSCVMVDCPDCGQSNDPANDNCYKCDTSLDTGGER